MSALCRSLNPRNRRITDMSHLDRVFITMPKYVPIYGIPPDPRHVRTGGDVQEQRVAEFDTLKVMISPYLRNR